MWLESGMFGRILAKQGLQLHGQPHVALDLELAAHEGHGAVEAALGEGDEVLGGHRDGHAGVVGGPFAHVAFAVGEADVPDAAVVAAEVELEDAVHPRDLLGVLTEPGFQRADLLCRSSHGSLRTCDLLTSASVASGKLIAELGPPPGDHRSLASPMAR